MNLEPLNKKFRARYYRVGHADSVVILADAMKSSLHGRFLAVAPEEHRVELFNKGEKVAHLNLLPGESVLLFDPIKGVIDEAIEPAKIDGQIKTRTKATSWPYRFTAQYGGAQPFGLLYGKNYDGSEMTDAQASGKPAFTMGTKTWKGTMADAEAAGGRPIEINEASDRYIYFTDDLRPVKDQIQEIFKHFGSTVQIVNIDNPSARVIKL